LGLELHPRILQKSHKDKDGADIFGKLGWLNTGTWEIDSRKLPKEFRPFSDWIHAHGMKFLLWFEPERVGDPNSWLGRHHREWLLPGTFSAGGSLLNEGNKEALNWLIDHVDGMIKSQGIDWYREDMNGSDNVSAWHKYDADDRQGITENLYVQGHLAFWDELRRRHPQLRIDSCASGGRRNDLESMRRGSMLTRSDFQFPSMAGVVEGNQSHTYGLSFWLPWQGNGCYFTDAYSCRSFYLPGFGMSEVSELLHPRTEIRPETIEAVKKAYSECAQIAPYMLCDYYPLTPYTLELDQWIGWQFNRPEQGDGLVQAFRRGNNEEQTKIFRLHGLDPAAQYKVRNFDVEGSTKSFGKDLMEKGLTVQMKNKPAAVVIVFTRLN
jgi:alpha-galactosidase